MTLSRPAVVIVLAAGEGTRMKSSTPKVLHPLLGRSLLGHVLTAAQPLEADHTLVVVGHGREAVSAHLADVAPSAGAVVQAQQNGTGHAVRIALDELPDLSGTVVVVCGDTPLLTSNTLRRLALQHDRTTVRHDQARPDQQHTRLPERNLAVVNADESRPLGNKQEAAGWTVKNALCYLRRNLPWQIRPEPSDQ